MCTRLSFIKDKLKKLPITQFLGRFDEVLEEYSQLLALCL